MDPMKLRLGTRKSLLAWAQSSWVAREIERLNPGVAVELVGIETKGDRIQHVPLQQIEGKDFFVAELDHALAAGETDLSVHSMKDLSLERPAGFVLAAVPPREDPRDVVLFGPHAEARLRVGETLRIGTSSPRRLENIPGFLARALPTHDGRSPKVAFTEIRGNVNTRLSRVKEPVASERYLDGVVLAFAGLIRLWADEPGRAELARLLDGVRWMVLPLRENPTAPAQGALAVECRADDARAREAIGKLQDPVTERQIRLERQVLRDWGGGCHQRFGATAHGEVLHVRGARMDGQAVDETRWDAPPRAGGDVRAWNGLDERAEVASVPLIDLELDAPAAFVAHSRAWTRFEGPVRVWTSGTASWFRLAEAGVWVEGCAEGQGFEAVRRTLAQPVLQLPPLAEWVALTHADGVDGWKDVAPVATYKLQKGAYAADASARLRAASDVFWSSASQFDELRAEARVDARHACGPGKTAAHLERAGVHPIVFPSVEEWKQWLKV